MGEPDKYKPIKVLMTTDTVGGVWQYSIELCKALREFNFEFHLVTSGGRVQANQRQEVEQLDNVTLCETNYLLEWMNDPWESLDESNEWLLQLADEVQPDIIHLSSYTYGALHWEVPALVVAHSDVYSWWLAVKSERPPQEWNEYFERVRSGLNNADYIVAPSKAMMKSIREIYNVTTPGEVIYNGRSSQDFKPGKKEPYIFSMGRLWDEAKNVQLLLKAAPYINHELRIAGDSKSGSDSTLIEGDKVSYLGKLSSQEIAKQLSAASIYVLPAKYEPFGLSVLEAALSGCALVLGNIDSLKEIWYDCAVFIDTDDDKALAETINQLMQDDVRRNKYAARARERAMESNTAAMTEKYLNVYQLLQSSKLSLDSKFIKVEAL